MKYLIVQEWNSTRGNHAGMRHMCNLLVEKYPHEYRIIVNESVPTIPASRNQIVKFIQKVWNRLYVREILIPRQYRDLCSSMFSQLKDGDEIFLLEYLLKSIPQKQLAYYIRKHFPNIKIYGMVHLTPSALEKKGFVKKSIHNWCYPLDKVLTLGSSLSAYLSQKGVPEDKISTGFHYVDLDYYSNLNESISVPIRIITMGAIQRNYKLLANLVNVSPNVEWVICRGKNSSVDELFVKSSNIHLHGYMSEEDLKKEMALADISLLIMDDTVGSNAVTTSMAMGLAMIVTDVGSIRDYCNDTNSFFCQPNISSIKEVISSLSTQNLSSMKKASYEIAKSFSIERVHFWFCHMSVNNI